MATGDIKWFQQGLLDLGNKIHNLGSDVLQLGIVTSTVAPSMATAAPHWGGTGTTNFATTQVGVGGGYTGPITLAGVTWSNVAGVPTLRATDPVSPQNAAGFANGAYGIIFNSTDANKRALAPPGVRLYNGTCMLHCVMSSATTATFFNGEVTVMER